MNTVQSLRVSVIAVASMVSFFAAMPAPVMAVPLITFTGGQTTFFVDRTFGYEFSTNSAPVQIFSLGFWDDSQNGLAQSHQVGIWSADGSTLLVSATIPSGTSAPLDSGFRFVSVTPVTLAANTSYLAGAYLGSEPVIRFTTATVDPAIALGSTRFAPTPSGDGLFTAPTDAQGTTFDDGYFGPNFNGVPEPTTFALAAVGLGVLTALGLRRRSRRGDRVIGAITQITQRRD